LVNIRHLKSVVLCAVLVLATTVLASTEQNQDTVFAQNSTSTITPANGTNVVSTGLNTTSINDLLASGDRELDLNNYGLAIEYYDKILAKDPNSVDALNNKGIALDAVGNSTEAIEYYDKALAVNDTSVDALFNKGFALATLGNYAESIEYYDKVLDINPDDVDAQNYKEIALDNLRSSDNNDDSNDSDNDNNDDSNDSDNDNNDDSNDSNDNDDNEFEKSNPLRDQIRNKVNEGLSSSGIDAP
jgi:tetratricopeptide (TPR) repeat protein